MFICNVNKNNINVTERETITSGSVNAFECEFVFSDDWDILQSTVSFKAADTVISVMLDNNNRCIIPWEVLAVPDTELYVGVVGYGDMGTEAKEDDITLPTIWAYLGTIVHGANDGEDPTPPTPGVYEQIMMMLADLEANKQDKITGNPGQIVGFDADGNAIAQDDTGGITYTAGDNIHISEDNVISADMYDDTAVKADIAELQTATASNTEAITKKQNTLIAGANITIENNTISAASYDDAEILAEISALDSDKQNKLTGTQNQIVGFDENGNAIAREGGADGYSPTVSIEDVPGGNQVTITDKNGPHSFDVMDGVDGYSPTVSIEETPGGNEITITDKNGAHSFTAIDSVPSYTIAEVSTSSAEEKAYRLKRDGTATGSTIVTRKHGIYYDGIGTTQYVENNAISIAGVVDSYGASVGMSVDKPRANIYFIEEFEDYYVSDFNLYRVKEPANKNSSGAKNIRFSSGANKVTNLYLLIYQTETATYPKCLIHHTYVLEPSGNLDGGYITVTDRSGAQFNVDKLLMQGKIVAGTFVTGYRGYYLALSPLFLSGEKSVAISQGFYALTQL